MSQMPVSMFDRTTPDPAYADSAAGSSSTFFAIPRLVFPRWYAWFFVAGGLDVLFTYAVLLQQGGSEANPIANIILHWGGFGAMVLFKASMMILNIMVCQYVYEHRAALAKRLAVAYTFIAFVPPLWGAALLWTHVIR